MARGLFSIILIFQHLVIAFAFYFTLHLYHKNTKNIILSYLSDLTLLSDRVGIDNPLSRWLRGFICLCRCEGLVCGLLLDWYLGSQKLREILTPLCCITLSSSRENQRSAQEVAVCPRKRIADGGSRQSIFTAFRRSDCYLLSTALVFPWRGKGDAAK